MGRDKRKSITPESSHDRSERDKDSRTPLEQQQPQSQSVSPSKRRRRSSKKAGEDENAAEGDGGKKILSDQKINEMGKERRKDIEAVQDRSERNEDSGTPPKQQQPQAISPVSPSKRRRRSSKKRGEDEKAAEGDGVKKILSDQENKKMGKEKRKDIEAVQDRSERNEDSRTPSSTPQQQPPPTQSPSKSPKRDKKKRKNENEGKVEKSGKRDGSQKGNKRGDHHENKPEVQDKFIVEIRGFDDGSEDEDTSEKIYFDLVRFFGECGVIGRIDIPVDYETKNRLGHAIIAFTDEVGWTKALAKDGQDMSGKTIYVS